MKYISDKVLVAFNKVGTASFALEPGVAVEVPTEFLPSLIEQGAVAEADYAPASSTSPSGATLSDVSTDKVAAIVKAMRQLLDSGNAEVLEAGGIPRINEIDTLVGFRSNKADREAAWAVVEG